MSCRRSARGTCAVLLAMTLALSESASAQTPETPVAEDRAAAAGTARQSDLGRSASLAVAHQVCFITQRHTVACNDALAGRGIDDTKTTPWKTVPGLLDIVTLSAGYGFICALSRQGSVRCWGDAPRDEHDHAEQPRRALFGDGKHRYYARPQPLNRVDQQVVAIAAAANSVCVRLADGTLQCMNETYLNRSHPQDDGRQVGTLSIVDGGACLLDKLGRVECKVCGEEVGCSRWSRIKGFAGSVAKMSITCGGECVPQVAGLTRNGKLQLCSLRGDLASCPELPQVPTRLAQIHGSCARTTAGQIYCWGGRPNRDGSERAQQIPLPEPATELSVGSGTICMRLRSRKLACLLWNPLLGRVTKPVEIVIPPSTL